MYVKPAPGFVIRDPDLHDHLPDEGRDVPLSDYWHRRLLDGDVVEAKPAQIAQTVAQATDTKNQRSDEK